LAAKRSGELPDLVDAMVVLAERSLAGCVDDCRGEKARARARARRRGQRPLLLVHLSEDRLAQALGKDGAGSAGEVALTEEGSPANVPTPLAVPFVAELHGGGWLGGESLLRLACDAAVVVVKTDAQGNVLDVGRRRRTIPPPSCAPFLRVIAIASFQGATRKPSSRRTISTIGSMAARRGSITSPRSVIVITLQSTRAAAGWRSARAVAHRASSTPADGSSRRLLARRRPQQAHRRSTRSRASKRAAGSSSTVSPRCRTGTVRRRTSAPPWRRYGDAWSEQGGVPVSTTYLAATSTRKSHRIPS
jgi:hypothetical protein